MLRSILKSYFKNKYKSLKISYGSFETPQDSFIAFNKINYPGLIIEFGNFMSERFNQIHLRLEDPELFNKIDDTIKKEFNYD